MKQGGCSWLKMRQSCLLADTVQVLAALQDLHTVTAVLQRTAVSAGHILAVL